MRISGLTALRNLAVNQGQLQANLNRLSTLKRINSGKDDPSGLIAYEALRSELSQLDAASRQLSQGEALFNVADTGLQQATDLLIRLRETSVAAAQAAPDQQAALRNEADQITDALRRIGNTQFQGKAVFSESAQFKTEATGDAVTFPTMELSELGLLDVENQLIENPAEAAAAIDDALSYVTSERGRLGSYQRTVLDSVSNVVSEQRIQLSEAASQIGDADLAVESALLAKNQILGRTQILALVETGKSQGLLFDLIG